MFVELCGTLVLIEHGKAKLLDLFEVVVHLKLHSKHRVQVVHSCFSTSQLKDKKHEEWKTFTPCWETLDYDVFSCKAYGIYHPLSFYTVQCIYIIQTFWKLWIVLHLCVIYFCFSEPTHIKVGFIIPIFSFIILILEFT